MFENGFIDLLLNLVPRSRWNLLSNIIAQMSFPSIGSPVSFAFGKFTVKEFDLLTASNSQIAKFLDFCYPPDLTDRDREIGIDRQYWPGAATFIVVDQTDSIKACAQYLDKRHVSRIPFELSRIVNNPATGEGIGDFVHKTLTPCGNYAEIYRCRRSFDLEGSDGALVVFMLFKALWAKTIQESVQSIYITFDPDKHELRNLYMKKLCFRNMGITVRFGDSPKDWQLLVKDCRYQEHELAGVSRQHFYMQTWFRRDLRKKNLHARPEAALMRPVTAHLLSDVQPFLFTKIVKPQNGRMPERRSVLDRIKIAAGTIAGINKADCAESRASQQNPDCTPSENTPDKAVSPHSGFCFKIIKKNPADNSDTNS